MRKVRALSQRRAPSNAVGDDFWQAPSLTASERAYMIRKAKEASVALVDHAHTLDGPVQWHYTGKLHGIQMYRGEGSYDRGGNSGTEFLCGVTTMMGSIEEVAVYFDQQTTEEMIAKKAEDVLDCGVLYSLVRGDVKNPFYRVSAKYQLYEGPSAFSRERDYCFLECQNTFRHASGRRGWVLSMHSIKLPNCPELDGVVRGSMYQSGYVFVEAEKDGYMDVMHSLQINFKTTSRLPHFMLNSALKRRILSVVTISREIRTTRMGRQTLLKKKELMPKRARALCVNCARKFSLFVRKTRCRVCGEVVCQPCAPQVMISTKQGPVKTRVCTRCYQLSPGDEHESVSAQPQSHNRDYLRRAQNNTRYSDILQDQYDHPDLYHEKDEDSLGEEDEDDGGLEEQSDFSVFAQSRFTEASRDSLATSQFGASNFESYFEESSHFDSTSELDDSQYYDGGSSESSFVSGTSSSQWKGGNSATSSIMGWNQASSVKPADGYIYDPQASTSSNFYGASDYGGSHYTIDEKSDKQAGRDKAAAPIPENEPSSHPVYTISPDTSYISNTDYKSTQGTADTFDQGSNAKATQGAHSDSSCASPSSDCASKTVSIQSLAKARSAHYGIKSEFPPPPPPLSPPSEEHEESEENASSLHLKVLKLDKSHSLQDRKPKGTATRKFFTPPPPKEGRREVDQTLAERDSKVARNMAFHAALANRDSRVSQASSRDSNGFGNTRSSAILEKVRRNRGRESDRASAVLKFKEEEHLMRMREIERIQGLAKEKAARRSMASSGKSQVTQNGGLSQAAAKKKKEQPRRSSHRSTAVSLLDSSFGPSPGSPPGTPPSMRGRRLPNDALSKIQSNRSISGNHSRRTDASSDIGGKQFLSNRSDANFARPGARVSLEPSAQSDDLVFKSQRSEYRVSNDSQYLNGQRLNGSPGASKRSKPSLGGQQLDSSYVSAISEHRLLDDLAFDASQLSLDKTNFSSSIAILEIPGESLDHIAMMERSSEVRSSIDSMLSEDLLNQSSAGMIEHINAMRARAVYKLPDEEGLPSYELQRRQEEHFKRMEELTKMTANHIAEENIRPRSSTLGGLHDSAISLTGYSGNNFGDSTISSSSSVSSVDVDQEFNFESRPLGRSKRSGTIPFALEDLEQVPDVEDDDKLSEGPDDFDTSIRLSEEHAEHGYKNEQEYRLSEECADMNTQVSLPTYHFGDERSLSDRKLPQVNENDDEDTDTLNLYQKRLHLSHTTSEDSNSAIAPISNDSDTSEFGISCRESCISAIDEELVGRPTNELFDMIRANRPMYNSGGSRSSDMMFDLEASHLRRMDELNRIAIDHLGNRISNLDDDMLGSAIQPGRLLHRGHRNEEKAMQWRSSDVMEEVYTKHQVDMERLRRRIRQLEEECRESIASVLTAEEMDLSEFDDDGSEPTHKGFIGRPSFNPQNSFMARSDLSSSTISEHGGTDMPIDEPLPARILFEQIAQLTQLQQEMAEAECDDDEEEFRKRIKEQYRVLRSIKANSREDLELLNSQARESVNEDEDEENWI
ncbi:unnamed protein product [Peronospora farinosa]|uniref:FYVE-type domain-containing protein n=1 Tax=Peronospora farinosa TaxID=134698 RepID=A0ABN8BXH5_9STRA|nr:unnamed protein product [Peronospora farinosa]